MGIEKSTGNRGQSGGIIPEGKQGSGRTVENTPRGSKVRSKLGKRCWGKVREVRGKGSDQPNHIKAP